MNINLKSLELNSNIWATLPGLPQIKHEENVFVEAACKDCAEPKGFVLDYSPPFLLPLFISSYFLPFTVAACCYASLHDFFLSQARSFLTRFLPSWCCRCLLEPG